MFLFNTSIFLIKYRKSLIFSKHNKQNITDKIILKDPTSTFFRILHLQTPDTNHEGSMSAGSGVSVIGDTESDDDDDDDDESTEMNRSHYISPEEWSGNSPSDKSDIWYVPFI